MCDMETPKRSKNFSEREKMLLLDIVKSFSRIIENKKTDGSTSVQKQEAWLEIAKLFNASCDYGLRTTKQLHALYDNLKKKAKRNMSDDRVSYHE